MDPFGNPNRLAVSSAYGGGDERPEQTGTETLNDQTYFVSQLNPSCNHTDCTGYFEMPECVTDMYLQALDGGDESYAALRQISGVYGPKEDDEEEFNINFNHNVAGTNVNPEPCPNEGCGCTGSYNGGAGAGTAVCGSCCEKPYEPGFNDKKRDPCCRDCCDSTYQQGLVNKKPTGCTECSHDYKYVPELPPPAPYCAATDATCCGPTPPCNKPKAPCCCDESNYQSQLCNKKPTGCTECTQDYKYVPELPPPAPYCEKKDKSCCSTCCYGPPDTYELIKNNDARKYSSKGPSRINFYADDSCGCPHKSNGSCNNNYAMNRELDWAELRKSAYSHPCQVACQSPSFNASCDSGCINTFGAPVNFSQKGKSTGIFVPANTSYSSNLPHQQQLLSRSPSPSRRGTVEVGRPIKLASGQRDDKKEEEEEEKNQASGRCVIQ